MEDVEFCKWAIFKYLKKKGYPKKWIEAMINGKRKSLRNRNKEIQEGY